MSHESFELEPENQIFPTSHVLKPSSSKSSSKSSSPTLLVVDDDADTCENLQDILSDFGFVVEYTTEPEKAIELAKDHPFDLAILDFQMPGMTGVELYSRLKEIRNDASAIIVTAYAANETIDSAGVAGIDRILNKPVQIGKLLEVIQSETSRPTLMIVDDDQELCQSLREILSEKTRFTVGTAHSGSEAQELLNGRRYDAVLVDLKLPDQCGSAVVESVRNANPDAEVIVITGFRHELKQKIQNLSEQGVETVCYKPFDVDELLSLIEKSATKPKSA